MRATKAGRHLTRFLRLPAPLGNGFQRRLPPGLESGGDELEVRQFLEILGLDQSQGFRTPLRMGQKQFRERGRPAAIVRLAMKFADILAEKFGGVVQQDVAIGA